MVKLPGLRKPTGRRPLRVLIVEDSENDALLLLRELRRGGYEPYYERVETAEAMREALAASEWDVVISDYRLPRFSALEALEVFNKAGPEAPFIVVSGQVGEDAAVEVMKAGAYDFLTKGKPRARLHHQEQHAASVPDGGARFRRGQRTNRIPTRRADALVSNGQALAP